MMTIHSGEFWVANIPFTVRLSRLDSLEKTLLLARIGQISEKNAKQVKEVWNQHIKPQF